MPMWLLTPSAIWPIDSKKNIGQGLAGPRGRGGAAAGEQRAIRGCGEDTRRLRGEGRGENLSQRGEREDLSFTAQQAGA